MSTSAPQPGYHHGNLPDALVEAALSLLREAGTEALSLRAVARRAGVSAMAPYRHFADKQALLAAVAEHGFRRLAAGLAEADAAADPGEALCAQGVAYVRFACDDPPLFRLMFGRPQPQGHEALHREGDIAYAVLASRVARMVGADARDDVTLACWSLVHGLASLLVDGQFDGGDPEAAAARVTRLLVRGL